MRKNRWKKTGILIGVFLLTLVVSSLILNRGTDDITVGLSDSRLPRVAFDVRGIKVNALAG